MVWVCLWRVVFLLLRLGTFLRFEDVKGERTSEVGLEKRYSYYLDLPCSKMPFWGIFHKGNQDTGVICLTAPGVKVRNWLVSL